jgi:hypothetical protein
MVFILPWAVFGMACHVYDEASGALAPLPDAENPGPDADIAEDAAAEGFVSDDAMVDGPSCDDEDVPPDGNECTSDVCSEGVPSYPPVPAGTICHANGGKVCDGAGTCVACNVAADCGHDTDCATFTCDAHVCAVADAPATKAITAQVPGDCHTIHCDGRGGVAPMADDGDLPVDGRECTRDVCTNGVPSNPPLAQGTPCAGGTAACNGAICGGCDLPTDCAGTDTACHHRTCPSHVCGVVNEAAGAAPKQAPGDCHTIHCDGSGSSTNDVDDTDLPVDANDCTRNVCSNGVPSNPEEAAGTPCAKAQGGRCATGAKCSPTFLVVRVGSGAAPLTAASTAAFVERRYLDTGALVGTLALPVAANGSNRPLTLSGTTAREGVVSLSSDGRYASMLGYATPPDATPGVATSPTASVNRVVARIDARDGVDTSTVLTAAFSGNNARFAVSVDGSAFWAGGAGSGAGAGLHYIGFGMTGGTQVLALPASLRASFIFAGQVYGSSADSPFAGIFKIGDGLPTTSGAMATLLPGVNVPQPYQFVFFDRDPLVPGADTLYVADDRAPSGTAPTSGGGIQKWTFNGTIWSNVATFNLDTSGAVLTVGMRGLAGAVTGTSVALVAVSADATSNRILSYVDDGVSKNPTPSLLATAAANTVYRSVALAP